MKNYKSLLRRKSIFEKAGLAMGYVLEINPN